MRVSSFLAPLLASWVVLISSFTSSASSSHVSLLRGVVSSAVHQPKLNPSCPVGAPCPAPPLCPNVEAGKTGGSTGCPIWIDSVEFGAGRIGMSYLPGRVGPGVKGIFWNRSMTEDIAAIKRWGASDIVTLIEEAEFTKYGVAGQPGQPSLKTAVISSDLAWHHWPIRDMGLMGSTTESIARKEGADLLSRVRAGGRILVHCVGGYGRTGTLVAQMLLKLGGAPEAAISTVRNTRPHTIETKEQEAAVSIEASRNIFGEPYVAAAVRCDSSTAGILGDCPLWIDHFQFGTTGSEIGMMPIPGRRGKGDAGMFARSIAADVATIKEWGATIVISLVEKKEYEHYGVPDLGSAITGAGIRHLEWPFPDFGLPGAETRQTMLSQIPEVVALLQGGGAKIAIHCAGGKGRTGTVAASFLVKTGMSATEAIATIRGVRPGTVENEAQEQWVAKSGEVFGPPLVSQAA